MSTTTLAVGVNRLRRALGAAIAWGPHRLAAAGPVHRPRQRKTPLPGPGRAVRR